MFFRPVQAGHMSLKPIYRFWCWEKNFLSELLKIDLEKKRKIITVLGRDLSY